MNFTDVVTVAGTRRTADGYLIAEAKAVRTGIQLYLGDEVGKPDLRTVRVYRPAEEVFSDKSLQSFTHAPVTVNQRTLLIHGARAALPSLSTSDTPLGRWLKAMIERGVHRNAVIVALANKLARIAWAALRKETAFDRSYPVDA